jgi:acyl-CoA thioester hydrolase
MGSWHESRLRVRFEETDTMQVVYYGKIFVWMEVGRVSLLREVGLPYRDWESKGLGIPVV